MQDAHWEVDSFWQCHTKQRNHGIELRIMYRESI